MPWACRALASPCPRERLVVMPALVFQYKVLSVLPGSGMGIAVSTPSTQKVSAWQMTPPLPRPHAPATPPPHGPPGHLSEPPWDVVLVWVEAPFSPSTETCCMESRSRKFSLSGHHSYRTDRLVSSRRNGSCIHPRRKGYKSSYRLEPSG